MKLTDRQIKTAEVKPKRYKLSDGNGLYLIIESNGAKKWRYKYSYLGKEKLLGLGKYPVVGLANAREARQECRKLLDQNIDPSSKRKKEKRLAKFNADNSFAAVAKEWHETNNTKWTTEHGAKIWRRLEVYILPVIGDRPITDINTLDLLDIIRTLQDSIVKRSGLRYS